MSYELTEPHFDDERTLLSARRVIPLDRVDALSRRKQWWLSATIAVAAALGTLGGFIYYRRGTPAQTRPALSHATQAGVGASFEEPLESAYVDTTERLGVEEEAVEAGDELSDVTVKPSVDSVKRIPRRPPAVSEPAEESTSAVDGASVEDDSERDRASRRVERWEERRERRIRRRNQEKQPNDLFRIDQIFEGAPRP